MAVMNESVVTGPTPGIAMKRRLNSRRATILTTRSFSRQYSRHSASRADSMASISSAKSGSSATATRTAWSKAPRPTAVRRSARWRRHERNLSDERTAVLRPGAGDGETSALAMASSALQRGWRVDETYVKVRGVWAYLGKYTFNWLKTLV